MRPSNATAYQTSHLNSNKTLNNYWSYKLSSVGFKKAIYPCASFIILVGCRIAIYTHTNKRFLINKLTTHRTHINTEMEIGGKSNKYIIASWTRFTIICGMCHPNIAKALLLARLLR